MENARRCISFHLVELFRSVSEPLFNFFSSYYRHRFLLTSPSSFKTFSVGGFIA